MNRQEGQIWYKRALMYGQQGNALSAKKAYAIARHLDPEIPPLPPFRNHALLRRLEVACLLAAFILLCWLVYYLLSHPVSTPVGDFHWWLRHTEGEAAAEAAATDRVARSPGQTTAAGSKEACDSTAIRPDTSTPVTLPSFFSGNTGEPAAVQPLLLLRTALYYFVKDYGFFPASLAGLVEAGYLDRIPEGVAPSGSHVSSSHTDQEGWTYSPPAVLHPQKINTQIESALQTNQSAFVSDPFAPLTLKVDRVAHQITLLQGDLPLKNWGVAIGARETPTPAGTFRIIGKARLADDGSNPYGSRWMRIGTIFPKRSRPSSHLAGEGTGRNTQGPSDGSEPETPSSGPAASSPSGQPPDLLAQRGIGIHGTHGPVEPGEASNGCIRMKIADLEELYDRVPNGILIRIL